MTDEEVLRTALKVVDNYISVPRDMISLCKFLGIKIKPLSEWLENGYTKEDFYMLAKNEDGAASFFMGYYGIIYNDFKPHHRIRFTIAEEVMHIVLGHVYDEMFLANRQFNYSRYAQYEHEAKLGASVLLMPPTLYFRYRARYNLKKLASIFDISVQAAYRAKLFYEENEVLLNSLATFCPRCEVKVKPDKEIRAKNVFPDRVF